MWRYKITTSASFKNFKEKIASFGEPLFGSLEFWPDKMDTLATADASVVATLAPGRVELVGQLHPALGACRPVGNFEFESVALVQLSN